jgi:hypothetical protein
MTDTESFTTTDLVDTTATESPKTVDSPIVDQFETIALYEDFKTLIQDSNLHLCLLQRLDLDLYQYFMDFDRKVLAPSYCRTDFCNCIASWVTHEDPQGPDIYNDMLVWTLDHLREIRTLFWYLENQGATIPWSHFVYACWDASDRECRRICDQERVTFKSSTDISDWDAILNSLRFGNDSHVHVCI